MQNGANKHFVPNRTFAEFWTVHLMEMMCISTAHVVLGTVCPEASCGFTFCFNLFKKSILNFQIKTRADLAVFWRLICRWNCSGPGELGRLRLCRARAFETSRDGPAAAVYQGEASNCPFHVRGELLICRGLRPRKRAATSSLSQVLLDSSDSLRVPRALKHAPQLIAASQKSSGSFGVCLLCYPVSFDVGFRSFLCDWILVRFLCSQ